MKPIPVDAARQIADQYQKDIVLLVAWDQASSKTHVVTWGREPPQKTSAAAAGDMIRQMLRLEGAAEVYEDFRREGEAASTVDALRRQLSAIREAIDKIVVTEGQDAVGGPEPSGRHGGNAVEDARRACLPLEPIP